MNDYGFGAPDGRDIVIGELKDRGAAYKQRIAELEAQVNELANVLMYEFEDAFTTTDGSEGAVQMAIRVLREQKAVIDGFQESP